MTDYLMRLTPVRIPECKLQTYLGTLVHNQNEQMYLEVIFYNEQTVNNSIYSMPEYTL